MAKRSATTDLNHDNWNEEETPEEAGTFAQASAEDLEKRTLKVAKRRISATADKGTKSAFSSFAGFKASGTTNATTPFSFLSNLNSESKTSTTSNGSQGASQENGTTAKPTSLSATKEATKKPEETGPTSPTKPSIYYSKLKGLNEGVSQWIKKHVDANPFCILTPIFKDYEKYLREIEAHKTESNERVDKDEKKAETKASEPTSIFGTAKTSLKSTEPWKPEKSIFSNVSNDNQAQKSVSIFAKPETKSDNKLFTSANSESNPFFKKSNPPSTDDATKSDKSAVGIFSSVITVNPATFSFGQSSTAGATSGFSFGSGKPFTFGSQVAKPTEKTNEQTEEDEKEDEEPPKPEVKKVVEEGSIFEQRCKVYIKKDSQFKDMGVGTLFLKPTPNEKIQLIVRAANSLGNILINTLLFSGMSIQRTKDHTLLVHCMPMPNSEMTSVLLRVKTKEDADILLENLEKHTKK